MKLDVVAPVSGARVEDDSLGHGVSLHPQPVLVMYVALLDCVAASGYAPFDPGVGEILAAGPRRVARVPRSEERRTCCRRGEASCPSLTYEGMVPPCHAECSRVRWRW